jgi:predicted acylesterase/phospholipase RssA
MNTFNKKIRNKTILASIISLTLQTVADAKETRVVISIDGGGTKGIIPATVLSRLEKKLERPLTDRVDVFAGTSVGGMIAMGLNVPDDDGNPRYTAKDLADLFLHKGEQIFHKKPLDFSKGYICPKYSTDGFEALLKEYFGDTRLSQTIKEVVAVSYDIQYAQPYLFRTSAAKKSDHDEFLLAKASLASGRAQMYFSSGETHNILNESFALVDGGNAANHPAVLAYFHTKELYPNDDVFMISIGTGDTRPTFSHNSFTSSKGGAIGVAKPTIDMMFAAQAAIADNLMYRLLPDTDRQPNYIRINKRLTPADHVGTSLDDTSKGNMARLQVLGEDIADAFDFELADAARRITQIFDLRNHSPLKPTTLTVTLNTTAGEMIISDGLLDLQAMPATCPLLPSSTEIGQISDLELARL